MNKPMNHHPTTLHVRGIRPHQGVCLEMTAPTPLTPDERQLLARQTGQLLVSIGSLLASQPIVGGHVSHQTSRNLIGIGRKLLTADECPQQA